VLIGGNIAAFAWRALIEALIFEHRDVVRVIAPRFDATLAAREIAGIVGNGYLYRMRMSKFRRATSVARSEPSIRRAYFDCRYGQLHMHHAIPGGGGFDEATTLLCLPDAPGLGRFFRPLLAPLGRDRAVYAPDLPGCGESDPAPAGAGAPEFAVAMSDFVESMRFGTVDLMAHGGGVAIALALLQLRPAMIGRLVLSPANESVRAQSRALRQPVLIVDLTPAAQTQTQPVAVDIERQAAELRDFLGLI